jgi:hypothetical protein
MLPPEPDWTWICVFPLLKPAAEAVMVTDPWPTAVTTGSSRRTEVDPAGIRNVDGETIALEGSLLVRVIEAPLGPAGVASVTGKAELWPGVIVRVEGTWMVPDGTVMEATVTLAVAVP